MNIHIDFQKHLHILYQSLWKILIRSNNSVFSKQKQFAESLLYMHTTSHILIQTEFQVLINEISQDKLLLNEVYLHYANFRLCEAA